MGGFVKVLSHVSSTSAKQSIEAIQDLVTEDEIPILCSEGAMLDFLDRFRLFRHMSPEDYSSLVKQSIACNKAKANF